MENEKKTAALKETETGGPVRSSVSGFLYQFMENHAPLFWVIFSFGMVLIVYKSFNLAFLNKTPYTWDDAFQHLTLALICILMMREAYQGQFHLGFRRAGFFRGLLLCWPALLFLLINLITSLGAGPVYPESLALEVVRNGSIGLFEEIIVRAILVGHMMHHWKGTPHRVGKAVLWSSVLFGVLHIGNALANPIGTAFQIFYATGIGVVFAATYLRTKNLWSCILVHGLVDFASNMGNIYVPLQADTEAYMEALYQVPSLLLGQASPETIQMVLEMVTFGIIPLTALCIIVGIFMLRKSKAPEIESLWEEM